MTGEKIYIEAGSGELIDKITILEIKLARIEDPQKLKNIRYELETLATTRDRALPSSDMLSQLTSALKSVNETLWDIEDDIRRCEAEKNFGQRFIELARAVYKTNDHRAALKKQINLLTGGHIVEEKSYVDFE
jgi:septal ring factor EnvC (AmiA/AmiB activator)